MSNQTTQSKPRLSQCRICSEAGFPGQMISFINSGQKKADGKILWNLLNEDFSFHSHRKFQSIENDMGKPPARPSAFTDNVSPATTSQSADAAVVIMALTQLADAIKLLALSNVCGSEEQREEVRKRCLS